MGLGWGIWDSVDRRLPILAPPSQLEETKWVGSWMRSVPYLHINPLDIWLFLFLERPIRLLASSFTSFASTPRYLEYYSGSLIWGEVNSLAKHSRYFNACNIFDSLQKFHRLLAGTICLEAKNMEALLALWTDLSYGFFFFLAVFGGSYWSQLGS